MSPPQPLSEFEQVIAYGTTEAIQRLSQEQLQQLVKDSIHTGRTPLHLVAEFNTDKAILLLIKMLASEASTLAVRANHEGRVPATLLPKNARITDPTTFDSVAKTLVSITHSPSIVPLSKLLSEQEIIGRYPDSNPENLCLAVQAINQTRQLIKQSSTHDFANFSRFPKRKKSLAEVDAKLNKMRRNYGWALFFSSREAPDIRSEYAISNQLGNCAEMADTVYMFFKGNPAKVRCEIFCIANGDHTFNVIGRSPSSNPCDPTTWGENAVVADAWSGEAYLARELPKHLNALKHLHYQDHSHYYLQPYNSRCHQLQSIYDTLNQKDNNEHSNYLCVLLYCTLVYCAIIQTGLLQWLTTSENPVSKVF